MNQLTNTKSIRKEKIDLATTDNNITVQMKP